MRDILRYALVGGLFLLALAGARPGTAQAGQEEVDLALVLAVDISYSMDREEQELQREGFAEAFRSPEVQQAIRGGPIGRIAVTYVEWAGAEDQRVVIPWTLLDGGEAIIAFADRISAIPLRRAQRTSVSGAIDFGLGLLRDSGFMAQRQVLDISGDGPNNQGRMVTLARDEAVRAGITINGLPILLKRPGYLDIGDLDQYFRDCVIGGPGAFVVPVRERDQFRNAIKTKILLEVSDSGTSSPLVQKAQGRQTANCMVGEMQWRDRMGN